MNKNYSEKRKDPRISSTIPLNIKTKHNGIETRSINISASGAYCQIEDEIPVMTKLAITLLIPGEKKSKKVNCEGVVVRSEKINDKKYNVAIFFSDISDKNKETLSYYINSLITRKKYNEI